MKELSFPFDQYRRVSPPDKSIPGSTGQWEVNFKGEWHRVKNYQIKSVLHNNYLRLQIARWEQTLLKIEKDYARHAEACDGYETPYMRKVDKLIPKVEAHIMNLKYRLLFFP